MTQFTVKVLNDIISDLLLNVLANIDTVTDANVGSVLRQMLESVASEIDLLYTQLQNIYDGSRVDTATSTDLEQIGAIVGVTRKTGSQANNFVTFQRNVAAPSDFTIAINSVVSTQPNTSEDPLRFLVVANTTFSANIATEAHAFVDGIYDYQLNERIIDSITTLTGTVLTVPGHTFVATTDYSVVNVTDYTLVDVSTINAADNCEVITGWTNNVDASAVTTDAVNFRQGTKSLKLGKTGTASAFITYSHILGSVVDASSRDLLFWFRVADAPTLAKIKNIRLWYGSGGSTANSKDLTLSGSTLAVGWNLVRIDRTATSLLQTGFPSLTAINFLQLRVETNNTSDTITSGLLNMDFFFFGENSQYSGDLVRWTTAGTRPDTTTNFATTYIPLSKEVECIAEAVGVAYNVGANKIVFKVSSIPSIDTVNNYEAMTGGSDIETDAALRDRIKNSGITGLATAQALENAVLAVTGVASVTVNDLPANSVAAEPHLYLTGTLIYKLANEVAQNDVTLLVTGTYLSTPGHTFVVNTDYILDADSNIVWQVAGQKPDNNTQFYTTYNYHWLGHVDIFVSGVEIPMPPAVLADVNAAVAATKAAGVVATVSEPTVVSIAVTCSVVVDVAYDSVATKSAVADALSLYLNSLGVGADVYRAELTRVIQSVEGVVNSTLTIPAADVTISVSQVAKAGTITVS